ncbi:AAA family ATPase [Kribbella sp. NPDC050124]|uniref:helix-turn-helix transcriptional regulator n=1 Tax=Kribbella sp. NPDC050124 TaxID=3364114 RepID=UPI0037B33DE4
MHSYEERPRLLGRRRECAVLDELVASARSASSGVLVLEGEAGIGKTALLEYIGDHAPGCRVVRATGVESEMEIPYAGVHQLCAPFLDHVHALPDPQRDALTTAFGLRAGDPPGRFVVSLAVLSLLTNASEQQPLICVVDDAQWLDRASAQTFSFVARRLLAERIVMVLASRPLAEDDDLSGLPVLSVRGLDDKEAAELLSTAMVGPLEDRVRDHLLRETRGNPLAVLELPRGLTSSELAFGFADGTRMPLATRIEEGFRRRLQRLPQETQRLLLLAAVEPSGDVALVWQAAHSFGLDVIAAAGPALDASLITDNVRVGAGVRFRHPLVRSAVYRAASAGAIREVHAALADVTDADSQPDRRTWHRAQATVGYDDDIAAALEASAARAQGRGGLAAAAAFLGRATELTADAPLRARRALAAAQLKHQAGAPAEALSLLTVAEAGPLGSLDRALVHLARAQIAFFSEHSGDAPGMLLDAARELEPLDATLARRTYLDALSAALFAGRLATGVELREVATAALAAPAPVGTKGPCDLLLNGFALVITEGYAIGASVLRDAVRAFRTSDMPALESLRWLWFATHAAHDLWDDEGWDELCSRHAQLARQVGALHVLPIALSARMGLHLFAGELSTVDVLVQEAASVTQATGSTLPPYGAIALAAWRGHLEEASRMIDAVIGEVASRGDGMGLTLIRHAQAVMYNGLGRYPEAMAAAAEGAQHPQELAFATWSLAELVEAAVRTESRAQAERAVEELAEMAEASRTNWALGVLARCRALLADDPLVAEALYREAVERLTRTRVPMVLARAHLLYGEWLRRQDRDLDAREQLRTAHDMFLQMGAEGFAERTRSELAATGETLRQPARSGLVEALTAQEAQIAGLAATGMTNPEIGAHLFISARTVEWHLRKVYQKLGMGSRKELRAAMPVSQYSIVAT